LSKRKPAKRESRKPAQPKTQKPAKRVSTPDERPPAPWGSAPLAELVILAGIVALAIGLLGNRPTAIAVGIALAGLGGLEVAIREHFAGYRSHSTLLAGAVGVLVTGLLLFAAHQILGVALGCGLIAFAIVFFLARRAFQRASGGLSYRIGRMRGS
jgi:hypothetical protein